MSDAVTPSAVPDPTPSQSADRAQFWRDTLAAFATSGQTVRAFCRDRGLHEKRFYTWRRDLGLSPVARPAPASVAAPARAFVPARSGIGSPAGDTVAALRNAGLADQGEREEAAHDVVVHLLVRPGQLFAGYDAARNGPMEGRFRVAVQNAVGNVIRTRRRHDRDRGVGQDAEIVAGVVPSRLHHDDDDDVLEAFREFLRREVGEDAVRLLDYRLSAWASTLGRTRCWRTPTKLPIRGRRKHRTPAGPVFGAGSGEDTAEICQPRLC